MGMGIWNVIIQHIIYFYIEHWNWVASFLFGWNMKDWFGFFLHCIIRIQVIGHRIVLSPNFWHTSRWQIMVTIAESIHIPITRIEAHLSLSLSRETSHHTCNAFYTHGTFKRHFDICYFWTSFKFWFPLNWYWWFLCDDQFKMNMTMLLRLKLW